MVAEVEPNRDIDLSELAEAEPTGGRSEADPEAPYGRKPDGTPFKRRARGRPGYDTLPPKGSTGTRRSYGGRGSSLETQIGALLFTFNMPIQLISARDALDAVEIQALAHAIDQECQRNPRFRKYVEQALAVQGGTSLVLVIAAIAGRRVIRHDLITVPEPIGNEGADAMLGGLISMTTGRGPINPNLSSMSQQSTTAAEV